MPQRPDFEKSFRPSRFWQGIPPTEIAVASAPVDLSWGLAWMFARVIGVISKQLSAYNDVITMISGFLTSVISSSDHASISRNALCRLLISTIFYSGFFSSEASDKRTNRVSTDTADKHACYISETTLVRRSREGHE